METVAVVGVAKNRAAMQSTAVGGATHATRRITTVWALADRVWATVVAFVVSKTEIVWEQKEIVALLAIAPMPAMRGEGIAIVVMMLVALSLLS